MRTSAALARALLAGAVVTALAAMAFVAGAALILTSWASSMALLVGASGGPAARVRAVAGGHLIAGLVGAGLLAAGLHIDLAGSATSAPSAIAAAILAGTAVAGTMGLMLLTDTLHPPAAANPVIALTAHGVGLTGFAGLVILGAGVLGLTAWLLSRRQPQATGTRR